MKKLLSAALALCLAFSASIPAFAAPVEPTPQKTYVDGAEKHLAAYNIGGYNYFRLQDLAAVLKATPSHFSVVYDGDTDTVLLGRGGECSFSESTETFADESAAAGPSTQKILLDGASVQLGPYNIGGYNYFRLGDLAPLLGFGLAYDAARDRVLINGSPDSFITVSFIDVGQGDSVFIDAGTYEVLIDAGTADKGETVSNYIRPYVDGDLELVIATHAHADHVGGLTRVLQDYQVDEIIDSGDTAASKSWTNYRAAAQAEPDCAFLPDSDMTIDLPDGARIQIIEALDGDKNLNNDSVTALLTFGSFRALFTGDNEQEAEAVLAGRVGDVDVFKAAHHGSRTANSMTLLSAITPEYVVVSCGVGNTYGHPHAEALRNFAAVGAAVYGTEKSGTIILTTDGSTYSFNTADALTPADAGA